MTSTDVLRYAGWSAYLSTAATIIGFVTLIVFFSVGEPFGTINDISSVILALSLLPLAVALYLLSVSTPWRSCFEPYGLDHRNLRHVSRKYSPDSARA